MLSGFILFMDLKSMILHWSQGQTDSFMNQSSRMTGQYNIFTSSKIALFQLTTANDVVLEEMHRLDHSADDSFSSVNKLFDEVIDAVEKRRIEILAEVKLTKDTKKKVLEEQLQIIQKEKLEVESEVESLEQQVEVRNITKKISDLNSKLDTISQLSEPRENCYIEFCRITGVSYQETVKRLLSDVGRIKTSQTFPSLCRANMDTAIKNLKTTTKLQTIDYHGKMQVMGGLYYFIRYDIIIYPLLLNKSLNQTTFFFS